MHALYSIFLLVCTITSIEGFFNGLFSKFSSLSSPTISTVGTIDKKTKDIENNLLRILENSDAVGGRGAKLSPETLTNIENDINTLENAISVVDPTDSPLLDGCWKLLYTSSPGTNSPIQRTFTSFEGVTVYQVVNTIDTKGSFLPDQLPDVSNTVCFGDSARLRVTALASTMSNPVIVPRVGDGKIFGFNIFGISSSRAPRDPSERIDFAFQEACFEVKGLPFAVPYPVPFKLLGDEAKGWLDITYLSADLRIARGNKGTIFVLKKSDVALDPIAAFATQMDVNTETVKTSTPPLLAVESSVKKVTAKPVKNKKPIKSKPVVIVFPAQLGTLEDYQELSGDIERAVGLRAYTAPLSRLDWPVGLIPSLVTKEYITGNLLPSKTLAFYLRKVDDAVTKAFKENPDAEIVLLAHSIGGWIARVWLSEWTTPDRRARVRKLITLGSPHNPPPADSAVAKIDQTRGLLKYITDKFPGSFDPNVEYVSIIGTGVTGSLSIPGGRAAVTGAAGSIEGVTVEGKGEKASISDWFQSLVAFSSYAVLSGEGEGVLGDGVIPLPCAELAGAEIVCLEGTKHSNFLPTPGKSVKLPLVWYGSEGVLEKWVQYLV